MAGFTTVAIFPTCGENSHFPISNRTVKIQLSLNLLEKITCFTRGKQAIVNSCDCSTRFGLCCKLHTHWKLLVFCTCQTSSYSSPYF